MNAYEHADEIVDAGLHIVRDAEALAEYEWSAHWPEIDADGMVVDVHETGDDYVLVDVLPDGQIDCRDGACAAAITRDRLAAVAAAGRLVGELPEKEDE